MRHTLLDERDALRIDNDIKAKSEQFDIKSVEGIIPVITNSGNTPFFGLDIYGKTEQKRYSGKNLLPRYKKGKTNSLYGVTFTINEDGSITVIGSLTNETSYFYVCGDFVLPKGEYILSSGTNDYDYTTTIYYDGIYIDAYNGDKPFTLESDTTIAVYVQIRNNRQNVNVTFYPMIRLASIADPTYEPYVGCQPSPNPEYDQKLENVGKWGNLFNKYTTTDGYGINANGELYSTSNYFTSDYIEIAPLETYSITYQSGGWCSFYDDSKAFIYNTGANNFMTPNNAKYARITAYLVDKDILMLVQADSGTTSYRPHTGQMEVESAVYGENLAVFYKNFENRGANTYTTYQENVVIGTCATTGDNFVAVYELDAIEGEVYTISADAKKNISWIHTYTDTLWGTPYKNYYLNNLDGICVTFEAQNTQKYVIGFYGIQGKDFEIKNPRINKGTEALPYTPYTKQSHTNFVGEHGLGGLPLGKTIPEQIANSPIHMAGVWWCAEEEQYYISDTVNNESGELVQRIGTKVLDGSDDEEWITNFDIAPNAFYLNNNIGNIRESPLLCDMYMLNWSTSRDNTCRFGSYFNIRDSRYSTVEKLKAGLAEKPVTVQYVLATPTVTKLTDSEIASYKSLHTNNPNTTIINDCGAYMKARYLESKYDDGVMEVVEKIVESKLEAFFTAYMNEIAELQGGDA